MMALDKNKAITQVLSDPQLDFKITNDIENLAHAMATNLTLLVGVYRAMWAKQSEFRLKPLFSAEYTFTFDYKANKASVSQGDMRIELTVEQFYMLLGKIDAAISPIHPLGTVLRLNDKMLPKSLMEQTQVSDESRGLVIVTGRKLKLIEPFSNYIVDYTVSPWPMGATVGEQPMMVSNMMVDQVVAPGFSNADEEKYADVLKTAQIVNQQLSTAFMTVEDRRDFLMTARQNAEH